MINKNMGFRNTTIDVIMSIVKINIHIIFITNINININAIINNTNKAIPRAIPWILTTATETREICSETLDLPRGILLAECQATCVVEMMVFVVTSSGIIDRYLTNHRINNSINNIINDFDRLTNINENPCYLNL